MTSGPGTGLVARLRRAGVRGLPAAAYRSLRFRAEGAARRAYVATLLSSESLARRFPFGGAPIVLLSYPRSGSSWIGDVLATAPSIGYLREPVNQTFLREIPETLTRVESDPAARALYLALARKAFLGVPPAGLENIRDLRGLRLRQRRRRRLLVKEVNPWAARLLAEEFAPEVLLLERHPAALAESFRRLGWFDGSLEDFGEDYGRCMRDARAAVAHLPHRVVRYEDVARAPECEFPALFAFLGVEPAADFAAILDEYCRQGAGTSPFDTRRVSHDEVDRWRSRLPAGDVRAVMAGYARSGHGVYPDT